MAARIDPRTAVGAVTLTVRDVAAVGEFYERVLGLDRIEDETAHEVLGAGGRPLVALVEGRAAPPRPPRTTGLFHFALLVPARVELARSLRRLIEARWPLAGASDHLVSEALYLSDPEGNGIEIYCDRPREQWRRDGDELRMATLPLDLGELLAEAPADAGDDGIAPGARMGHVHLEVADLGSGERFYGDLLGLEVTARDYLGALFLAAGGYHHHVGLNTWRGEGVAAPPPGALGLRHFELTLPTADALDAVVGRLAAGGVESVADGDGARVEDPAGIAVRLRFGG